MDREHDDLLTSHPDLRAMSEAFAPPPPPTHRRRVLLAAAGVALLLAVAGGVWWFTSSTVSQSDYDEVVADLDSTRSILDRAERDLATQDEQIAALDDEVASLRGDLAASAATKATLDRQLDESAEQVATLSEALAGSEATLTSLSRLTVAAAYWELNLDQDWFAELQRLGADVDAYDELLTLLGHDETMDAYLASGRAWLNANNAVFDTEDDPLIDAWLAWNDSAPGSDGEAIALDAFILRLTTAMQEHATNTPAANGTPMFTASSTNG